MTTAVEPATTPVRRPAHRGHPRRRHAGSRYLFVLPALGFIALLIVYPLAYNLYLAVHDVTIANLIRGEAAFVGTRNFGTLFGDPAFRHSLAISFVFTLTSLFLQFVIGFAFALFFKRSFPGSRLMRALLLLGWLLPIVVTANVWRWLLDGSYGAINRILQLAGLLEQPQFWLTESTTALASVIMVNVWIGIPFNMILLLAGLQAIPNQLYEAASLDGAGPWQRFRYVTLPQIRPVALTVLLLAFVYTFKVFDQILVMTNGGPVDATTTLPITIYHRTFTSFEFGQGAAAATILLAISLCLALVYLWLTRREEAD